MKYYIRETTDNSSFQVPQYQITSRPLHQRLVICVSKKSNRKTYQAPGKLLLPISTQWKTLQTNNYHLPEENSLR